MEELERDPVTHLPTGFAFEQGPLGRSVVPYDDPFNSLEPEERSAALTAGIAGFTQLLAWIHECRSAQARNLRIEIAHWLFVDHRDESRTQLARRLKCGTSNIAHHLSALTEKIPCIIPVIAGRRSYETSQH